MLASAGMLIPEDAIPWIFQAEDKRERYRGWEISTLIHRHVGLERKTRAREKWCDVSAKRKGVEKKSQYQRDASLELTDHRQKRGEMLNPQSRLK